MKDRISAWGERFEAFSLRERGLIALGIIVVMFMLWDALLLGPQENKQKQIVAEMHGINKQTEALTHQIEEMSAALKGGEARHIESRVNELTMLLSELEQQQKELTVEFIQPVQMAGVLRDMLHAENGLVLTQLKSLGAEPLFPVEEDEGTENQKNSKRSHRPEIYKHGLRIVFEGDYFKTLNYLRALEAMPWRLYWDNVEYQVTEYPKASIAITVHTLSLHEGWIGV
jgi:MSHA biogenesis protein MshJ